MSLSWFWENGAAVVATIAYDNQGRRSGSIGAGTATSYTYDPISRLAGITDDLAGTTADTSSTFGYSPASQMVSRTRSNNAYGFSGYMSVSRDYAVNGLNQYVSGGAGAIGYDANGNLTSDGAGNIFGYTINWNIPHAAICDLWYNIDITIGVIRSSFGNPWLQQ